MVHPLTRAFGTGCKAAPAARIGACLCVLAFLWLGPVACYYSSMGGPTRYPQPRDRPMAHRPPPSLAESRANGASGQPAARERRERVVPTFPNEPGHAFFGEVTSGSGFSVELLDVARGRAAEVIYTVASHAIREMHRRRGRVDDWRWTTKLREISETLAASSRRVWSYQAGRNSTIVVEVTYDSVYRALLDEFHLPPDMLDYALLRTHDALGNRPFAMRVIHWRPRGDAGEASEDGASVDGKPPADREPALAPYTRTHVVVVGVPQPRDERFPGWPTASSDAAALAGALREARYVLPTEAQAPPQWERIGREPERVTVLVGDDATRQSILAACRRALAAEQYVVLAFVGHALVFEGSKWLVPVDGSRDDVAGTCVSLDELSRIAFEAAADREARLWHSIGVCILEGSTETLYRDPGGHAAPVDVADGEPLDPRAHGRERWAIFAATRPDGAAVADHLRGHGLFTYFLVRALTTGSGRGAGDGSNANGDGDEAAGAALPAGWLTDRDLHDYVRERVEQAARSLGKQQRPTLSDGGPAFALKPRR